MKVTSYLRSPASQLLRFPISGQAIPAPNPVKDWLFAASAAFNAFLSPLFLGLSLARGLYSSIQRLVCKFPLLIAPVVFK